MKILIIEHPPTLAENLRSILRRAGFLALSAQDSQTALQIWAQEEPDLVVLDLNLPDAEIRTIYQRMRSDSEKPVLLVANREDEEELIVGLDFGAQDYIFKPIKSRELAARVRVLLRRQPQAIPPMPLKAAGLTLDCFRNEVYCRNGSRIIRLTPLETCLLQVLMLNAGNILDCPTLIESIWGPIKGERAMLKQLVYRLRRKLAPVYPSTCRIRTVTGVGYGFL